LMIATADDLMVGYSVILPFVLDSSLVLHWSNN